MGWKYVKIRKTKAHDPGHWPETKRLEAVGLFCSLGSLSLVAQQLSIPLGTLETWQKKDWWKSAIESVRSGENEKLDAKLSKALDKALDKVTDMLENGEYIYDQKTGKIRRMPVKLRDANHAFNSLVDKRQLIRKLPTKITESSQTEQKLQQLAEQFATFTKQSIKNQEEKQIEFIEGENVIQNEDGTWELQETIKDNT